MKLKDKITIVTASTRGIGLAVAEACAREGAVVYMAARNLERAEKEAARLNAEGLKVKCVYNDAKIPESYISMADTVAKNEGRIDVLVNNFGTSDPKRDLDLANTDADVFIDTVTLNLRSVFMASKAVIGHMKNGGSIINISSVGGSVPDISQIAYGTSKAAINYLTKLIAVHEAKNNIRCNAVLPGMTATDAVKEKLSEDFRSLFLKHIPLCRIGLPEEIAAAVLYFASDSSAYTTGQILTVSGGFGLATPVYGDLKNKLDRR
jgi:NAD(P)-dependent dehydrogenase (short-subunit alcohol dehydrogenase family)